jgi:multiple antibiotic resistance protein
MINSAEYIEIFIGILAILNPLGAIPIIVSLTTDVSDAELKKIQKTIITSVSAVLLVSLLVGQYILAFFGISIDSFRVGGGILILLMAISMLHAKVGDTKHTEEESIESQLKQSVAVVPISIPLLAGPGAMSTVILYAHKKTTVEHYLLMGLDILAVILILSVIIKSIPWISKRISQTGINVFTRIMGLILSALAVEFITQGLKGLFPILNTN